MNKLIVFGFDAKSKTWYEAPGYSTTVLGSICIFANMLDEKAGIDLFKQRPILKEAVRDLLLNISFLTVSLQVLAILIQVISIQVASTIS